MEETLALVNRIIKDHEQIIIGIQTSEEIANDVVAILELERPLESFVPGRLDDQRQSLRDLQQSLERVDKMLQEHFGREEKSLLSALEKRRNKTLASAFSSLLDEHKELTARLAKLKEDVAELVTEGLSRSLWEGKAYGMRAYIRHTQRLIEAHAETEQSLLQTVRKELERA